MKLECKHPGCKAVLDRNESINHKGLCNKHYGEYLEHIETLTPEHKTQTEKINAKELEILNLPAPFTSKEVNKELFKNTLNLSTVSRKLSSLVEKEKLYRKREGRSFNYYPVKEKQNIKPFLTQKTSDMVLVKMLCPGAVSTKVKGEQLVCVFEGNNMFGAFEELVGNGATFKVEGTTISIYLESLVE